MKNNNIIISIINEREIWFQASSENKIIFEYSYNIYNLKEDDNSFDEIYDFIIENIETISVSLDSSISNIENEVFDDLTTIKKIVLTFKNEINNEINNIKKNIENVNGESNE